jgi:hypothetical protein
MQSTSVSLRQRTAISVSLLLVLALVGCQKTATVNLKTPAQRVAVYNGILAESTRAATTGVISLQKSNVLTVAQAGMVLDYTSRVANASKAVAVLQQTPGEWSVVSKQIHAVLVAVAPPSSSITAWLNSAQAAQVLVAVNSVQETIQLLITEASK